MNVNEIDTNSIQKIINSIRYREGLNHNVPKTYEIVISVLDSVSPNFKFKVTDKHLDILDDRPKHHVYRLVVGKLTFYFLGDFYHNNIDTDDEVAVKTFFNSYHHDFYHSYRYSYKKVTDEYRIHKILEDCENGGDIIKVPKTL